MSDEILSTQAAVVLAGGLGTRLGSMTKDVPKPLMQVGERPFLEYQLAMLKRRGMTHVWLLTGYLGEQICHYFGGGEKLGLALHYSQEPKPLGTAGALAYAKETLPAEFVLVYGDSYLDFDYQAAFRQFALWRRSARPQEPERLAAMIVARNPSQDVEPGNVKVDPETNNILSYKKGAGSEYSYVDAGVLILTKAVVELIPNVDGVCNLEQAVYPTLAEKKALLAITTGVPFFDIGTPDRLSLFERSLL